MFTNSYVITIRRPNDLAVEQSIISYFFVCKWAIDTVDGCLA